MVTYIRQARQSDPETLLLNGGDFYQGTMWYTVFKYQPVVEFSNVLNYTAGSLGNHDWDDGGEGLQPFVNGVNFPVLAANLVSSVVRKVRRSVVVRVRGELVREAHKATAAVLPPAASPSSSTGCPCL